MAETGWGMRHLAIEERALALLSVAYRCRIPNEVRACLKRAAGQWNRGEIFLAHMHLAFARLPRLGTADAHRVEMAAQILDAGMPAPDLLKELDLDRKKCLLARYDPNEPRVSPGSGRESGEWAKDTTSNASSEESNREQHVAGDVIYVGVLIGRSVSRPEGGIPKTSCIYNSLLGDFEKDYTGDVECPQIRRR